MKRAAKSNESTKKPARPSKARKANEASKKATTARKNQRRAAAPAERKPAVRAKRKPAARPRKVGPRADLGAPVDVFFVKQPPHLRAILDELRALVDEAAPEATSSLKWGMPFYTVDGQVMCALAGFKAHVNLILSGPPETFTDPDGLLEGDGKTGRHLKLRALDELPRAAVHGWLRAAAALARANANATK